MSISKTLSWSDSKVGYDPGQKQSITIKFKSRSKGKLTFSFEFYAHSLGLDSYTRSQRHNVPEISIYHIKKNGDRGGKLGSYSWTYQLHGSGASTSKTDSFTVSGADNGETSFYVYYSNDRVGTNTPWYGPKSTGACDLTRLGKIATDDNTKVKVNYYPGGLKNVKNLPSDVSIYRGSNYKVSKKVPTHQYYTFKNGYDKTDKWKEKAPVNTTNIKISAGSTVKDVDSTLKLWACWSPVVYTYHYYLTKEDALAKINELTDLQQSRKYGTNGKNTPNLNDIDIKNVDNSWRTFKYWEYIGDDMTTSSILMGEPCSVNKNIYCWPSYEANNTTIMCHYGFDEYNEDGFVRIFKYKFNDTFDLMQACKNKDGTKIGPTNVRPGFKLIGWIINSPPDKVFQPGKCTINDITFSYGYKGIIVGDNASNYQEGIDLYAVWEYYSSLYVFTEGKWRLVIPYVRTEGKWIESIAKVYTPENTTDEQLEEPKCKHTRSYYKGLEEIPECFFRANPDADEESILYEFWICKKRGVIEDPEHCGSIMRQRFSTIAPYEYDIKPSIHSLPEETTEDDPDSVLYKNKYYKCNNKFKGMKQLRCLDCDFLLAEEYIVDPRWKL